MKTPDEEVAQRVLRKFREMKLLTESSIQKIGESLAQGALSAEDWRLIVEKDCMEKEELDASKCQ